MDRIYTAGIKFKLKKKIFEAFVTADPLAVAPACGEGFYRFWGVVFHKVHKAAGGVSIFGTVDISSACV